MIVQIASATALDRVALSGCHYGRKILSCLDGYGTDYDFCRFFRMQSHGKDAWLMLQNSTLLVSTPEDFSGDSDAAAELSLFVEMHQPFRTEGAQTLLCGLELPHYQTLRRSVFRLVPADVSAQFDEAQVNRAPKLDDVYAILTEGFPNLITYDLWLTDTSHMVRRGLRHCYTYQNMTAATAVYDLADHVLIGQVATRLAGRGKGYARDFLHWLANDLDARGKTAILYALDIRRSFYEEIGFQLLETEQVWERQHPDSPDNRKGAL